jgi:hypothetical protein
MNLVSACHLRNAFYAVSKSATSNCMYKAWKFS